MSLKKFNKSVGLIIAISILTGAAQAATPINSCAMISSPGNYVLTQNIINSGASTCIFVTSNDVVLDGAGYTIDGINSASTNGVYTTSTRNVTVKNLLVSDWERGIYYDKVTNGTISNDNAFNNYHGIDLSDSTINVLANNNATSNQGLGISLWNSSGNTVTGNIANFNGKTFTEESGISLHQNSNNNIIINNLANSNSNKGIDISDSTQNVVEENVFNSNGREGIYLRFSNFTLIKNNTVNFTNGIGILLQSSNANQIINNNVANSLYYIEGNIASGIRLESSISNQISGNTAKSNTADGISLDKSTYNNILNNIVSNNNFSGIHIELSDNNQISGNTANSNTADGISLNKSSYNNIANNIASNNNFSGIDLGEGSNYNTIANNNANSNDYGILLFNSSYNEVKNNLANNNKGFEGEVNGPPPSTGIMVLGSHNIIRNNEASDNFIGIAVFSRGPSEIVSINNTVEGNTANNNKGINSEDRPPSSGIILVETQYNSIANNIVSYNERGIRLFASNYNNITANTVTYNNRSGIKLQDTNTYNNIVNNIVNNNDRSGIVLALGSRFNAVASNTVSSNLDYGIFIDFSPDNTIYNNLFNNAINFGFNGSNNSIWNITKTAGTNIIGGAYIGGNVWANNAGTGFSQTCTDGDSDGICDSPYTLDINNVDYLPLAYTGWTPTSSIGYSALVATGQSTSVQSSNGSFGLLLKGQTKTINNSVILNNTGDISAKVEARINDSIGGMYGLVSGANVLNATNFALGLSGALMSLSSFGADVQVAVAPPGVTALDAMLGVPNEQAAGDYSGTVVLTFSNNV